MRLFLLLASVGTLLCPAHAADKRSSVVKRFLDAGAAPDDCGQARHDAVCALFADAAPAPGAKRWSDDGAEIWVRELKNGERAFALINNGARAVVIDVIWKEYGLRGSPRVWDVQATGKAADRGKVHGGFGERVEPGESCLFRVKPQ